MGKLLLAGATMLALGGAGIYGLRHRPAPPPLGEEAPAFQAEASGQGFLIRFQDLHTPLRALRWVPCVEALAAQVTTQSDRQLVAFFVDGRQRALLTVPRPQGVADGFWRLAELRDAGLSPDGAAVLLYGAGEASLALAIRDGLLLWARRGGFQRLALEGGQAFLFGGGGPVERVALEANAPARTLEVPADQGPVEDLLPTGKGGFLAAHPGGLSSYRDGKGWTLAQGPAEKGVACASWRSSLARAGAAIWWQGAPGSLLRVKGDGSTLGKGIPEDLAGTDGKLLTLLGADGEGRLWLGLARPLTTPAGAGAKPPEAEGAEPPEAAGTEGPEGGWEAYAAQGLDRVYRWDAARGTLERFTWREVWPGLRAPADLAVPGGVQGLCGRGFVFSGARSAWWVPLAALPFQPLQPR
jgi:hypothetical protein